MLERFREYQLDLMLVMIGICGITTLFSCLTRTITARRKFALLVSEISATVLMIADRFAYIYRGNESDLGYYMVRITNFLVFLTTLLTLGGFNLFLEDLFVNEGKQPKAPRGIRLSKLLIILGLALVVLSQFTGMYYTFDEHNLYQRATLFPLSYVIPLVILLLQLADAVKFRKTLRKGLLIPIILFPMLSLLASAAQALFYGVSLTNITIVAVVVMLYIFVLVDSNSSAEIRTRNELERLSAERTRLESLLTTTSKAFSTVIDSRRGKKAGHSLRVAECSRKIAELAGKSDEECTEIYCAALMHDVGKLKIPHFDVAPNGKLTEEQYRLYTEYTSLGGMMLADEGKRNILSDAAQYHHEWYDGSGYPDKLKGEKIPDVARIIAIADSYDKMTTKARYRNKLLGRRVREEFITGAGSKYDPVYSKIMLQMIDSGTVGIEDKQIVGGDRDFADSLECGAYKSAITSGLRVSREISRLSFDMMKAENAEFSNVSIILFDSLDGIVHDSERAIKDNRYVEYGEIWFDGHYICTMARNIEAKVTKVEDDSFDEARHEVEYAKAGDHVSLKLRSKGLLVEVLMSFPENFRYAMLSLTGENCSISNIRNESLGVRLSEDDILRISEAVSYINRLESDLKNVQVDGQRSAYTEAVKIEDGMRIDFHSMSLPTAELVWHCPAILLFSSEDGKIGGESYNELALIRLDGEIEDNNSMADNSLNVSKDETFDGWDQWKADNKKGREFSVNFRLGKDKVTLFAHNAGLNIRAESRFRRGKSDIYAAITGDRCALTDIRVIKIE